ncbi:hypothetical protein MBBAR_8c00530 [Methanobrevibacter arboriphilus JCM 13429 = DSM 1125]|uniref:DUF4015 domain-containing protein n=3 Tax=Methanobrevibacter arboriphilus TaxID=39441 RepID=A0A1V6N2J0_METAZ|nr:hypothetical protein MBBAR_8c00530 [Methanobrevibacter arboriphilus JCM 13429 = DSM 1125]
MQNNHQSSSLLANSNENLEDDIDLNSSTNSSNNSNSSNNNNINNSNNSSSNSLNVVKTSTNVNNKPTTLSQSSILLASNSIYKYINKYGKLPNYVTISGYKYSMSEFMYILSKTITYKYNKITSSIKVKYDVKNPSKASGNSIKGTISSKTYYSYAKNIVAFIEKNNQAPNFVTSSLGKIQYQTAIFGLNKVLNYIYVKGKLPSTLSFNVKASHSINKYLPVYNSGSSSSSSSSSSNSGSSGSSSIVAGKSTKLSQTAIFQASKNVKNYVLKYGKLPNYVTISGFKFSIPEYTYLVSKAIAYKCLKYSNSVNVKWNVKNPSNPSGVTIKKIISKSRYYALAKKAFKYIDSNNRIPNYISSSFGKIQYQTFVYGFSRIGEYMHTYKSVPSTLTLSVSKTSALNKNIPKYSRSSSNSNSTHSYNLSANKNAIWVHSGDMKNVDLDLLGKYGIGNIFIHEDMFNYPTTAIDWIKNATAKGFKIHIWFTTFYNATSNKWTNPIIESSKTLNQAYFNKVISRAKYYAGISGVAGIHLDYLRYPGTSGNNASIFHYDNGKNGADAITEFVRQLSVAVKAINPKIILSAALMPEKNDAAIYYGQDAPRLGQYLDVLVPMLYEGNYGKDNAWIQSTTKWYITNSGGAEVWGGLYAYHSDKNPTRLTVAELTEDCKSVLDGGGNGVAIFRWGIVNLFNLLGIK